MKGTLEQIMAAALSQAAGPAFLHADEMTNVQGQAPAQRMVRVNVPGVSRYLATKPKWDKKAERAKAKAARKQSAANRRKP